jgi:DNA-binding NarL/FixJ family response regulator
MADVVYMISDMLFSSKLREAAKASGVTVQAQRDAAAWAAAAREAKLAIVDLRMPTAWRRSTRWRRRRRRRRYGRSASSTTSGPTSWTRRAPRAAPT